MASVKISDNIYWVGAIDWDVRNFHGYLTPVGSTYNAYLIIDEKITLIDTVKEKFTSELIENISEIIDPSKIDYLISNHVEPDHSGALPAMAKLAPNAQIITSPNGLTGLTAYYGELKNMKVVKTGDTLSTGKYTFRFVLMPMVHWPDSMSTYLEEEKILFSNDAFGQHIASNERFDDELAREVLFERAANYYANIVLPFGFQVNKLLGDASGLPGIELICPSHGVIIRSNIGELMDKYAFWAAGGVDKSKALIVYDTMWNSTAMLAETIKNELEAEGITTRVINLADTHESEAMTYVLEAGYIAVGSPTLNRNMMPSVAAFLTYMKGLSPKNKRGRAFGSYGWSGESIGQIENVLKEAGFELDPQLKCRWRP